MVRKLDALIDDPSSYKGKMVLHARFLDHPPMACIEAPVTEFDVGVLRDVEYVPLRERNADAIFAGLRSGRVEGFRSVSRGMGLEDARMNVYIVGWDSIEVCIFFFSCVRIERAPC
jgi:hypothetical protein